MKGFEVNDRASRSNLQDYVFDVEEFDFGNGSIQVDGFKLPPGATLDLFDLNGDFDLGDALSDLAISSAANMGLDFALSKIGFLQGDAWWKSATKSGLQYAGRSFIASGYKSVDWDGVAWASAAGGLSSGDATNLFQGQESKESSLREAIGSALQRGAVGYTISQGDLAAAATGSFSGLMGSDTLSQLEGGWEVLSGAAKGALTSAFYGTLQGEVEVKNLLIASGTGAFQTQTVANLLPFSDWAGDPRNSAVFQATNAAISTALSNGNAQEVLLSATRGAFMSQQNMTLFQDSSPLIKGGVSAAFGTGLGLIQGQNLEGVGISALQSVAISFLSKPGNSIRQSLLKPATQSNSLAQFETAIVNPQRIEQHIAEMEQYLKSSELEEIILESNAFAYISLTQESINQNNGESI